MKRALLLGILLIVLSGNVYAAVFTSSASPTVVNSSSIQFINFTINNVDSLAIKEVNIRLPQGFSYVGNAGTSESASFTLVDDVLRWHTFQLSPSSTGYFWFKSTNPLSLGEYNFNVSAIDTNDADHSLLVNVTVVDNTAPTWSNLASSADSTATYKPDAIYDFNITWNDNIELSTVYIEHNFSGTLQNYTISSQNNLFKYNYTGLNVSDYVWKFYAIDSSNNTNSTTQSILTIDKAKNLINVTIGADLNKDANANYNEQLLVKTRVDGAGTISLFQDDILVASQPGVSLTYSTASLSLGQHTFKAIVTSVTNTNYLENSTGVTYTVTVDWPPPKWTVNVNIAESYSPDFISKFSVDWTDVNDPNGFNVSIIEMNLTGSPKNYTMNRTAGTNTTFFNVILPAGTFYWKAYANNSLGTFNSTLKNNFTVLKASPAISLDINHIYWQVQPNLEVNVSCTTPANLQLRLYRNGTKVDNPDVNNFDSEGNYLYVCNTTSENQNYTFGNKTQLLTITTNPSFILKLEISAEDDLISVVQGHSNSTTFKVINMGNLAQNIEPFIAGILRNNYDVSPSSFTLNPRGNVSFRVTFAIGEKEKIGDKDLSFIFQVSNVTPSYDFVLRVLPSDETVNSLQSDITLLKSEAGLLLSKISALKSEGKQTVNIESLYESFVETSKQAENYFNQKDYYNSAILIDATKETLDQINFLLSAPIDTTKVVEGEGISPFIWVVIIILVVGVLGYFVGYKKIYVKYEFDRLKKKWGKRSK